MSQLATYGREVSRRREIPVTSRVHSRPIGRPLRVNHGEYFTPAETPATAKLSAWQRTLFYKFVNRAGMNL